MISIEKIIIKNYRKFYNDSITLDRKITAIAGANNSGKTSLVELMSNLFIKEKKDSIKIEDMSSKSRLEDERMITEIIKDANLDYEKKIEKLRKIHKDLNKIMIGLVIQYEDSDNIESFSSYLADVDINKRNFYFKIEYEYKSIKEEDIIEILDRGRDFKEVYSQLESKIYYCDENFENEIRIKEKAEFFNLFNYHCVYAIRKLSDTSDEKQNFLSKHLLKTVRNNVNWKENLNTLIEGINNILDQQNLSTRIDAITLKHVKTTLDNFSKTNGGNTGKLGVDFKLENRDIEKVLLDFIHIYFEQDEGIKIKEQKQGLGYSNLIYLLLEGQIFSDKIDERKVNLLIFEEPEAHLHPQMENIFIRYISAIKKTKEIEHKENDLEEKLKEEDVQKELEDVVNELENVAKEGAVKEIVETVNQVAAGEVGEVIINAMAENQDVPFQMLITTHSSEMTKTIGLSNIRVLRSNGHTQSKVYDLNNFMTQHATDRNFYEKFFQFNMVEMVFADKLILFEGDAERLLFKYLISNMLKYERLSSQYISYIQVGGAYAHKYLDLIKFLEIKSLIFTDIDYEYKKEDVEINADIIIERIMKRVSSNETIKTMVRRSNISKILKENRLKKGLFLNNKNICLKFQTDVDGYARTLEDALLYKLILFKNNTEKDMDILENKLSYKKLNIETVFSHITKKNFKLLMEENKLLLSNTKKSKTSLRDRIDKLKNKTDFMYALIESGNINDSIPAYVEEGLDWLQD
ncbi:AAA family ATPase [Bacillus mycoides]|uniref:ATP-dependent nuclease n=1 Tax=Bacillus mycoides TaxID=1405 RepID=UPI00346420A7